MKKLMTKSGFARLAGVSPGAISKQVKTNLAAALHGKRIDASHPAAVAYLAGERNVAGRQPKIDRSRYVHDGLGALDSLKPTLVDEESIELARNVENTLVYMGAFGQRLPKDRISQCMAYIDQGLERLKGGTT